MKERIKNILNFKKPSRIVILTAAAIVGVLTAGFAVNGGTRANMTFDATICYEGKSAILALNDKEHIPYVKLGSKISLTFRETRPSAISVTEIITKADGSCKYAEATDKQLELDYSGANLVTFTVDKNWGDALSSHSEDYYSGNAWRCYRIIYSYNGENAEEAGIWLRTDPCMIFEENPAQSAIPKATAILQFEDPSFKSASVKLICNKVSPTAGNFTLLNLTTAGDIMTGEGFALRNSNGETMGNWAFHDIGINIPADIDFPGEYTFDVNFVAPYANGVVPNPLENGSYTLEKEVSFSGETWTVSTKFQIGPPEQDDLAMMKRTALNEIQKRIGFTSAGISFYMPGIAIEYPPVKIEVQTLGLREGSLLSSFMVLDSWSVEGMELESFKIYDVPLWNINGTDAIMNLTFPDGGVYTYSTLYQDWKSRIEAQDFETVLNIETDEGEAKKAKAVALDYYKTKLSILGDVTDIKWVESFPSLYRAAVIPDRYKDIVIMFLVTTANGSDYPPRQIYLTRAYGSEWEVINEGY
ncbi:MAG: hypothetical protein LBT44_07725 [Clostridiales bacterium]|jgi:hypothetical protein|nr:hypothetical protein [Clostridiales bacterium]